MYSLIALGFVLVYKATDAVNFAQGEFVMIAGFVAVGALTVLGVPLALSILLALAGMVAFGFALERVMLRKLIGRPVIAIVMATIGLAAILRGLGPFGIFQGTRTLPLPLSAEPVVVGPLFIPPIQLVGGLVSLAFLAGFGYFFLKSRKGIAMRAVADNQQVALAMGINVERYFGIAWAMTGVVSALGGVLWGNMLGVDVNLALVGFKVFPVVILGGLDSIPGAVIGTPVVLGEERVHVGGRSRWWLGVGRRARARPRRPRPAPASPRVDMIHRECGVLKTTYEADMALYPLPIAKYAVAALAVVFFLVIPLTLHEYYLSVANLVWIAVIGALGLNILVGYTGQVSIGHGAFMSVGAYTAANLANRLGSPWPVNLVAGGLMAALIGAIVGIPSLRIKGLYLAIATLAGQLIIEWTINHVTFISGGVQASIEVPRPRLGSMVLSSQRDMYYFLLVFVVIAIVGTMNLVRSRVWRAFIAIRDQDIAAEIIGIDIFRYKLLAFAISSFYAGVTGVLYTYFLGIANYEQFQIGVSIDYLAMIIIGGLGSVLGSIFGAIFVTLLPIAIRVAMEAFGGIFFAPQTVLNIIPNLRLILFGTLIVFFLVVEPEGLNRLWRNIRNYFRVWPFAY